MADRRVQAGFAVWLALTAAAAAGFAQSPTADATIQDSPAPATAPAAAQAPGATAPTASDATPAAAFATQPTAAAANPAQAKPTGKIYTVPAGTKVLLQLRSAIN